MKLLVLILSIVLFSSCDNGSAQRQIYKDSAVYYANKWKELLDSGYSQNDSIYMMQKARGKIYEIMRKHYIDKSKE